MAILTHRLRFLVAAGAVALLLAAACGGDATVNVTSPGEPTATAPLAVITVGPQVQPTPDPNIDENAPPVVAARQDLFENWVDVPLEEIVTVSVTPMTWSDSCLDVTYLTPTDEVCAQVITPGYLVVFQVGETQYEYHTDETGDNVRIGGLNLGG